MPKSIALQHYRGTAASITVLEDGELYWATDTHILYCGQGGTNYTLSYSDEQVRDVIGTALVAGTGISITVNDPADTITIASTISAYTDEQAQDAVGSILTDSTTIDFTYDDAANTITAIVKDTSLGLGKLTAAARSFVNKAGVYL